ncbi:hypothetical protein A8139_17700 [Marinomonas primoryensis]|uniref:Uncharacterized protein n=1 Tax=Marinomonas primoryensis TaxID=178399 RepID=A0A2Z4PX21_9GAMM|nr:hypothetical protein [Marinomonas primoryensis]AWY01594.1 hypothetical protein A8139_17700 [Marinomonas primoryensis]
MIHHSIPIQYCFSADFENYKECIINYKNVSVLYYQFFTSRSDKTVVIADGCADIQFCCDEEEWSSILWGSVLSPQNIHFKSGKTYCGGNCKTAVMTSILS